MTDVDTKIVFFEPDGDDTDQPRAIRSTSGMGDVVFRGIARAAGALVLAIMALVGVFLAYRAWQALEVAGWSFLTTQAWEPDSHNFGIAGIIVARSSSRSWRSRSAVPLATATALYISEYAPERIKRTPDQPCRPHGRGAERRLRAVGGLPPAAQLWCEATSATGCLAGWPRTSPGFPSSRSTGVDPRDPTATATVYTSSTFIAGIVVAMMVTPIICSVMREVFSQAPVGEREGAFALGATRWGMIRAVVLPFGRGGMIGGTMLGLGRALGETIAVYMIISPVFVIQPHILQTGATQRVVADRAALRCVVTVRAVGAVRRRTRALPDDVGRQLHRVIDHRPQPVRRGERGMTAQLVPPAEAVCPTPSSRFRTDGAPSSTAARRSRHRCVRRWWARRSSALSLTALLFTVVAPFNGLLGFVVVAYVLFLAIYALLVSFDEAGPAVRDRLAGCGRAQHGVPAAGGAGGRRGLHAVARRGGAASTSNFFTEDMSERRPARSADRWAVPHTRSSARSSRSRSRCVVTVPLGLTCAVFLSEVPGPFARFVRTVVEAMTALPSIVAGLFIYATLILILGVDKSGFAAAMALSVMMLPIIIRAADVVLRLVPGTLREASYALGSSRWRTVLHVVLPTARSGLTTAVILGTARGIGETSPVLLTAGYTTFFNADPFSGPQMSLPLAAFTLVASPEPRMIARGFGAAAVLMGMVLMLFVLARIAGGRGPGELTARQRRRRRSLASRRERCASLRDGGRLHEPPAGSSRCIAGGIPGGVGGTVPTPAAKRADLRPDQRVGLVVELQRDLRLDQQRQVSTACGSTTRAAARRRAATSSATARCDFAVSEIPYGLTDGGVTDVAPDRRRGPSRTCRSWPVVPPSCTT